MPFGSNLNSPLVCEPDWSVGFHLGQVPPATVNKQSEVDG